MTDLPPWEPPFAGTELEHLTGALDRLRWTFRWKADGLDLSPILVGPQFDDDEPRTNRVSQDHELEEHFDQQLIRLAAPALENGTPVTIEALLTFVKVGIWARASPRQLMPLCSRKPVSSIASTASTSSGGTRASCSTGGSPQA